MGSGGEREGESLIISSLFLSFLFYIIGGTCRIMIYRFVRYSFHFILDILYSIFYILYSIFYTLYFLYFIIYILCFIFYSFSLFRCLYR